MGSVNTKQPKIDVDNFHIVIIDYDYYDMKIGNMERSAWKQGGGGSLVTGHVRYVTPQLGHPQHWIKNLCKDFWW